MLSTLERSISIVLRANTPTFATTRLLVTVISVAFLLKMPRAMQTSAKTIKIAPPTIMDSDVTLLELAPAEKRASNASPGKPISKPSRTGTTSTIQCSRVL